MSVAPLFQPESPNSEKLIAEFAERALEPKSYLCAESGFLSGCDRVILSWLLSREGLDKFAEFLVNATTPKKTSTVLSFVSPKIRRE